MQAAPLRFAQQMSMRGQHLQNLLMRPRRALSELYRGGGFDRLPVGRACRCWDGRTFCGHGAAQALEWTSMIPAVCERSHKRRLRFCLRAGRGRIRWRPRL